MLDIFKQLVSRERPNYIISMRVAEYGQLSAVTCKFERGGVYYTAVSFYTDTWICGDPTGPGSFNSVIPCKELANIARIYTHSSISLCKMYPEVSISDLQTFIFKLKSQTLKNFDDVFQGNSYGDTAVSRAILSPIPSVIVTVTNGGELIGTILVTITGVIYPVFMCNSRIKQYVEHMQKLIRTNSSGRVPLLQLGE